jgi:hypothetical protein
MDVELGEVMDIDGLDIGRLDMGGLAMEEGGESRWGS